MTTRVVPLPLTDVQERVQFGTWAGFLRCLRCGALWQPGGANAREPGATACPSGCNRMELEEYAAFVQRKRSDEAAEHAGRVREQRQHIDDEIEQILADPDVDDFAERMSDDRPRAAEETLALVRGTTRDRA